MEEVVYSKQFRNQDRSPGIEIMVGDETLRMLSKTSFRGVCHRKAGNFRAWVNPRHFLCSKPGMGAISRIIPELLETPIGATARITLTFVFETGWDQVVAVENLTEGDLEGAQPRQLSLTATATFLKKNRILAPLTEYASIALTRIEGIQFLLENLCPGENYGVLEDDMTDLHGLYWLDLDNDGEEEVA